MARDNLRFSKNGWTATIKGPFIEKRNGPQKGQRYWLVNSKLQGKWEESGMRMRKDQVNSMLKHRGIHNYQVR